MTFLEFIRKNLLIAVIVIFGILVGLIMMDYGNSGSAFSRDYRIEVNGTRYKAQYTMEMGSKTQHYLARMQRVDMLYMWSIGVLEAEENLAVNRLLLREAAAELGICPSNEQIDEYIKTKIPAFQENGQFSYEAYKEVIGYRNGELDSTAENDIRELVADMIICDTIFNLVTANVSVNTEAHQRVAQATNPNLSGFRATLQLENQEEPAAPSAEVLKQYWAENQNKYMTEEKRSFTVIKLSAAEDVTGTAALVYEGLVKAPGAAPESIITAQLADLAPDEQAFDYEIQTYDECTLATAPDALKQKNVTFNGAEIPLNELIFNSALTTQTAGQYSTYYPEKGDLCAYIIRIDSITPSATQSFEQAEEAVRQDWIAAERIKNFYEKADTLQKTVSEALAAGKDMKTAFEAATASGATVEEFTDVPHQTVAGPQDSEMRRTHTGSLAPIVKTPTTVIITGISSRTINAEEPALAPEMSNMLLAQALMQEWIITAYTRYKVIVPKTEE